MSEGGHCLGPVGCSGYVYSIELQHGSITPDSRDEPWLLGQDKKLETNARGRNATVLLIAMLSPWRGVRPQGRHSHRPTCSFLHSHPSDSDMTKGVLPVTQLLSEIYIALEPSCFCKTSARRTSHPQKSGSALLVALHSKSPSFRLLAERPPAIHHDA